MSIGKQEEQEMNILAFAASNSKKSINKQLLTYATSLLHDHNVELIDINDFELPIYSEDLERERGIPQAVHRFLAKIASADALMIAYAEHNGGYTVAYKNLFDWASRANRNVYQGRSVIMLATSPGASGAKSVLSMAVESAQSFDGKVAASFSLPSFYDNFDLERQVISHTTLKQELMSTIEVIRDEAQRVHS